MFAAASSTVSSSSDVGGGETQSKSFYGQTTPQPAARPVVNNVRVYNGGAPVGFVDTPSNIHPIASLTPYQNRFGISASYTVCTDPNKSWNLILVVVVVIVMSSW